MRFRSYLDIDKFISPLKKLSPDKVKKTLKNAWKEFTDHVSKHPKLEKRVLDIINKKTKSNFKSLSQIEKQSIQESTELNEDFKHFWNWFEDQGWGAVSIFPTLSLWFEFDKLFDEFDLSSLDFKRIAVYSLIWISLVTGKHISMWRKWKKENPEEYEKEGKPGPFSFNK